MHRSEPRTWGRIAVVPGGARATRATPPALPTLWFALATTAALLAATASIVALVPAAGIYHRETSTLADAATAQDVVNLLLVAPLLVALGSQARRGHARAHLLWLGCLAFTVYNYAIYAFSIHFGPLFLPWVAVLGLSTFALVGDLSTVDLAVGTRFVARRTQPWVGWFLIAGATLFTLLWLREIIPDLAAGSPSTSASAWKVPTNPVHVLDLAFFLPATATSGILLLRRHPLGHTAAACQLTWLALTCLPILVTPLVASARANQAEWAVAAPVGVMFLASLYALSSLFGRAAEAGRPTDRP